MNIMSSLMTMQARHDSVVKAQEGVFTSLFLGHRVNVSFRIKDLIVPAGVVLLGIISVKNPNTWKSHFISWNPLKNTRLCNQFLTLFKFSGDNQADLQMFT